MKTLLLLMTALSTLYFAPATNAMMLEEGSAPSFAGYVPDMIAVNLDRATTDQINADLMRQGRAGVAALDRLAVKYKAKTIIKHFPRAKQRMYRGRKIDLSGWHKIHFQKQVDVSKVAEAFKKLPGVIDARPIPIYRVHRTPNDPFFYNVSDPEKPIIQWHLDQIGGPDINAPEAWDFETGRAEIIVAVPDTGVRWFHGDLGGSDAVYFEPSGLLDTIYDLHGADGNLWINEAELNGTPDVDDDDNGFLDDMIGWDWVNTVVCDLEEDCLIPDNDPRDFAGHGTHVAGIIAALNNNGYAVSSTAGGWGDGSHQPTGNGVKIMPLRIGYLGSDGYGYVQMDWAASAIEYAADNGARLVNCSWGSSDYLQDAVDYFLAAGGLIFNSAGNDGDDSPEYLGTRDDVISVASTNSSDCKSSFSDYGDWIDISAPGSDIWSLFHAFDDPEGEYIAVLSGTSMASPMALSVAALIWSQNPTWTADQVRQKLFDTADAIDGPGCNARFAGQLGAGRVNAYLAVGSCEGDLNGDGVVDGRDLADLIGQFNCTNGCSFDMTYDGVVNAADLAVFVKDFTRVNCP